MTLKVRLLCSFLIGAGVGAGASYLALRGEFDKKLNEEIDLFKASYKEKKPARHRKDIDISTDEEPSRGIEEKVADDIVRKQVIHYENYAKKYRGRGKPMEKESNLTKKDMLDIYEDQMDEEDFEEELEDDDLDDADDTEELYPVEESDTPYAIKPGKFQSDSTFDKVTLLYFPKQDLVIDEDTDEEILDPAHYLGDDFRKAIGIYEAEVAYIRNERMATDYEVILQRGQYVRG